MNRVSKQQAVRQKKKEKLARRILMGSIIIRTCVNIVLSFLPFL